MLKVFFEKFQKKKLRFPDSFNICSDVFLNDVQGRV